MVKRYTKLVRFYQIVMNVKRGACCHYECPLMDSCRWFNLPLSKDSYMKVNNQWRAIQGVTMKRMADWCCSSISSIQTDKMADMVMNSLDKEEEIW